MTVKLREASGDRISMSPPYAKAKQAKLGFSLLEVLASLVVTTLLIVATAPLVTQMLATWLRGNEVVSMVELQVRGLSVLRDDLTNAIVWRGFGRTEDYLAFQGNETTMSFPAASGLTNGRDGLEMISVAVTNSLDGRALVRRRASVIGSTRTSFADPAVLFSGPYKYFFKYYSQDGGELTIWTDPYSLPSRVALNIVDERNHSSLSPIQFPVFASMSSACVANSDLPNCPIPPEPFAADDPMLSMGIPRE